jgi:hypothetical protein
VPSEGPRADHTKARDATHGERRCCGVCAQCTAVGMSRAEVPSATTPPRARARSASARSILRSRHPPVRGAA